MVDEEVDRHPLCSAAVFLKILHCPLMFISMTFVQLQHAAGSLSSTRSVGGRLPEKRDMQTMQVPTFYRLSYKLLMHLMCLSEETLSFCWNDVQTPPFLPRLHPKHTTSSLFPPPLTPTSLIYILVHRKLDLLWRRHLHLFFFSPLRILALPEVHRSTAGREISHKTLHLLCNRLPLRISLPFRFRLVAGGAILSMHSKKKWLNSEVLQSYFSHHRNFF